MSRLTRDGPFVCQLGPHGKRRVRFEMSSIRDFEIGALKQRYGLSTFVETGCYRGDGIAAALEVGFERAFSCDISHEFVRQCRDRFQGDDSVTIFELESLAFLRQVLPSLSGPTLFWLDAHFPHVYGLDQFESSIGKFPLPAEIALIATLKPDVGWDVVVADDLRVIADSRNPRWRPGELPEELVVRNLSITELFQPLAPSHELMVDHRAEGALILTPKPKRTQ